MCLDLGPGRRDATSNPMACTAARAWSADASPSRARKLPHPGEQPALRPLLQGDFAVLDQEKNGSTLNSAFLLGRLAGERQRLAEPSALALPGKRALGAKGLPVGQADGCPQLHDGLVKVPRAVGWDHGGHLTGDIRLGIPAVGISRSSAVTRVITRRTLPSTAGHRNAEGDGGHRARRILPRCRAESKAPRSCPEAGRRTALPSPRAAFCRLRARL